MAFEPIYDVVAMDGRQRLCSDQIVVEARLIPPPTNPISKILTISCVCDISASESFTGEARYTGKVSFKVLYVDADGGNFCMDYVADFSDKVVSDSITPKMQAQFASSILDTDIVSVSPQELKLATVVEVELFCETSQRVKYLSAGGESIYTHEDNIEFCRLIASTSASFGITDNINNIDAAKLLLIEPTIITTNRICNHDSVVVEGKAVCNLVFETNEGMLVSYRSELPFSEEVGAAGCLPTNIAVTTTKLISFNASFEGDGNQGGITLEYAVELGILVYGDEAITPIIDAFCVKNELLSTKESVEIAKNKLCMSFEDRVEGSVTLDVNMPIVDNILGYAASRLHISNAYAENSRVLLEGIVTSSIIYYSQELNSKSSVAIELPFSLSLTCAVEEGDVISANGQIDEILVKIRRGNELDIKANIALDITAVQRTTKLIITELTLGEEISPPNNAISIHIAKAKESLWEVAKALCTTPEQIMEQNPTISLPLEGGERIIAYRQLTR